MIRTFYSFDGPVCDNLDSKSCILTRPSCLNPCILGVVTGVVAVLPRVAGEAGDRALPHSGLASAILNS